MAATASKVAVLPVAVAPPTCSRFHPDCAAWCCSSAHVLQAPIRLRPQHSSPNDFFFVCGVAARKQEIIKVTEQLIEAINSGDFEAYT